MSSSQTAIRIEDLVDDPEFVITKFEGDRGSISYPMLTIDALMDAWYPEEVLLYPMLSQQSAMGEAMAALDVFESLRDGWDGTGTIAPSQSSIGAARWLLSALPDNVVIPHVSPSSNGTLSLEWDEDDFTSVLELGESEFSFFFTPRVGSAIYRQGDLADFSIHWLLQLLQLNELAWESDRSFFSTIYQASFQEAA